MGSRQVFPFEEPSIEMMVSEALRTTTKTILDALGVDIPPLSDDALMDIEDAFAEWADESHELAELGIQSVIERNTIRQPRNALEHRLAEAPATKGIV